MRHTRPIQHSIPGDEGTTDSNGKHTGEGDSKTDHEIDPTKY